MTDLPPGTFQTPRWVQDAVFYQIFPDRFARSSAVPKPSNLEPWESPPTRQGFKGGDLLGVVENLDYLQDLGINAIYFCPVFRSTANHRYHTHDYYEIDPILGGSSALERLLDEAHRRDMRIVLDGVFNHCGRGFFQFNHILENGSHSPYTDWFTIESWPLHPYGPPDAPAGYRSWWNERSLPEFNTDTRAVREFLWGVGEHWIARGIDGWRLDVPNDIDDDDFWREFRRRVKAANPEAYIVGEIWGDARRWLQGDQFDAVMNYPFAKACLGFFTRAKGMDAGMIAGTGLDPVEELTAERLADALTGLAEMYPWEASLAQLNLLDSHDVARFISVARGDETAYRLAVLLMLTFPGAPCIYYGDEIGMSGGGTDIEARAAFIWERSQWNSGLRDYIKGCIELRHEHEVLRRGTFGVIHASDDVIVFERRLGKEIAFVALNASTTPSTIDVDMGETRQMNNVFPMWESRPSILVDGQLRDWNLPPRTGQVIFAEV
jgi:cyclomaltodextrinase